MTVTDVSGTYFGTAFTATDLVKGLSGAAGPSLEGVPLSVAYYSGTYSSASQLAGVTSLSAAPLQVGLYTVSASFAGSTDYASATALANFTITQAIPTVNVTDAGGTYSGTAFAATDSVQGVSGAAGPSLEGVTLSVNYYSGTYSSISQLTNLTPLSGAPIPTGQYTVVASFAGSTDYISGAELANFIVAQATPTVSVSDSSGIYSGTPFVATTAVAGIDGSPGPGLEGISPTLTYYSGTYTTESQLDGVDPLSTAPLQAGSYTVLASFAGSADYSSAMELANYTISQATPEVTWGPLASIVYGTPLGAAQLDASANVPGSFKYSLDAGAYLNAGSGQTLSATFTPQDSVDYATITATSTITVDKATPTLELSDPGGAYNGSPFPASVTISGSGEDNSPGASLGGITPTLTYYDGSGTSGTSLGSTPPTAAGTYTVVAGFAGDADYSAVESAPVTFTIKGGTATITLTSSTSTAVYGQYLTFVATVAGAATPIGSVTFLDGGTPLATIALDSSGKATLTLPAPAFGNHSITATYSGYAALAGAQSEPVSTSVGQSGTTVVLVPHPVLKKKKVVSEVLTAEIEPTFPGSGVPTGMVTFELLIKKKKKITAKVLGSAAVNGDGTLTVKPKLVLSKVITIVYTGDTDFKASMLTAPKLSKKGLL